METAAVKTNVKPLLYVNNSSPAAETGKNHTQNRQKRCLLSILSIRFLRGYLFLTCLVVFKLRMLRIAHFSSKLGSNESTNTSQAKEVAILSWKHCQIFVASNAKRLFHADDIVPIALSAEDDIVR